MFHSLLPTRWRIYLTAALAAVVGWLALWISLSWYRQPIAGVLVDPNGVVSSIGPAYWDGKRQGLRFPDRIIEVDGVSTRLPTGATRATVLDAAVERSLREGREGVEVIAETAAGKRRLWLRLQRLDPLAWWSLAGVLFFAATLYVGAGLLALWVSPRGRLARTWATLTVFVGLFHFTMFDFHTSRRLVPLFYVAFAMVPLCLIALALRLPDDAPILRRFPWIERVLNALGLALAAAFIGLWYAGGTTTTLQIACTWVFAFAHLFFVGCFLVRFLLARASRRAIMAALLYAMVPVSAIMGLALVPSFQGAWKSIADLLSYPAVSLAPLATLYAFVRHDLWGSRAVLSRVLTFTIVGTVLCAVAVAAGAALGSELGAPFRGALFSAAVAGVAAALLVPFGLRLADRRLFPARAGYKPTVEQLSEQLVSITSPDEVARAVERTVKRWLPCDLVELALEDVEPGPVPAPESERPRKNIDERVQLTLPVAFADQRLGTLLIGEKRGGALFSDDDLDLLHTIVNQGALALAHAHAYRELEARRRQQAAAWRGEREALVETVAAEIAHEVRYPINYFRSVFERVAQGESLDAEDVDVGREEVDRLERMVSGLRRMAAHRLERRLVSVADLLGRAEVLLRDELGARSLRSEIESSALLRCDFDQATQIVVNLLSNALEAAGESGEVGLRFHANGDGAELEVWDDGPGFVGESSRLFAPWYTTKPRGTGLGLAITHRLVRAHGWSIDAHRNDGCTRFVVSIARSDVVLGERSSGRMGREPPSEAIVA
jgi:signal transduction histidine kinase